MDYRRALLDGHGDQALERGRNKHRSPGRRARGRDYIPHASEDWGRRRSRSPVRRERAGDADLRHPSPSRIAQKSTHLPPVSRLIDMKSMDRSRSRNRSLSRPVHSRSHQHSILVSPDPLADLLKGLDG
jgi:hypothetical protein